MQNCVRASTEILTDEGIFTVKELVGKSVRVQTLTDDGPIWHETIFRSYGVQPLMEVVLSDGMIVYATPTHEWVKYENGKASLAMNTRVFTKDLMDRKKMNLPLEFPTLEEPDREGYAHGFVFGDGHRLDYGDGRTAVKIFPAKIDMLDLMLEYGQRGKDQWFEGKTFSDYIPLVTDLPAHWKRLPVGCSRAYALGFILGLASSDGSVDNRLRLFNKSQEVMLGVQRLARYAGLRCHNPYLAREISPFDGSEKPLWCCTVSTHNLTQDHFIRDNQASNLRNVRVPKSVQVLSVRDLGISEEVYCCQIPIWHNFTLANGTIISQCWHVAVDHPVDPFTFAFNQLMLGGGVGFNILPEYVYGLPIVKFAPRIERIESFDCDYIVTDNREGWVDLLRKTLEAFFYNGKDLTYCTRGVREKGKLIAGFGGVASGPEELVRGISLICEILTRARGRKLKPVECLDIMNIIGMVVVAGNVRRSAEIAIGSPTDSEFLMAKDWSRLKVPEWRQMSNNTVQADDTILLPAEFWRSYEPKKGEPYGLFNKGLCQKYGRLTDGLGHRSDPHIVGPNPCAEILLESHEACNLAEQFLPNIENVQEFGNIAALLLRAAKAIGRLPFWHAKTREVVSRNNRIGLGVTGFQQAPHLRDPDIFNAVYDHLEEEDKRVSREMGCGTSIKLTTVKPSGTLSLLAGVTPGIHAAYSPYYIRRISFAANDKLVDVIRDHGYNVEPKINIDGSRNYNTLVGDFPHAMPYGTKCVEGYSAIDQLEDQVWLQTYWADNSVSMTCYYRSEELPEIQAWMRENYAHSVKTASFLLHSDHGFTQAPYEEITEAQYYELAAKCRPITKVTDSQQLDLSETVECGSGGCPMR